MNALDYFEEKYELDFGKPSPIEIPNVSRNNIGGWLKDLNFQRCAEVGVEQGKFSKILLDQNPTMEYHCIDSWSNYKGYTARLNNKDLPKKFYETKERLRDYNVIYHKDFSKNAVRSFEDESLDFVYIDGSHDLPWVMEDIILWHEKVKVGGIVSGHDYIKVQPGNTKNYTIEAVNWFTELKPIPLWFLIGTKAKVKEEIRDDARSWFWIKT